MICWRRLALQFRCNALQTFLKISIWPAKKQQRLGLWIKNRKILLSAKSSTSCLLFNQKDRSVVQWGCVHYLAIEMRSGDMEAWLESYNSIYSKFPWKKLGSIGSLFNVTVLVSSQAWISFFWSLRCTWAQL